MGKGVLICSREAAEHSSSLEKCRLAAEGILLHPFLGTFRLH